ncbi:MarR family winged helix-turn-helix transcriptional regulator [Azospirillum doebereinerae]|nr:MarR family transcriptional regulator [Azospirillum doebereinerae]
MAMDELYAKPGHLLRRAHQISMALFTEECAKHDLTSVQYAALVAIDENPGVDATRLSGLIAFDRSTLGGVIERLEAKELIYRRATEGDKRVKLLYLSPAGRALLVAVTPAVERVQERILEPLRPADRKTLIQLMIQLVNLHNDTMPSSLRLVVDREAAAPAEDTDGAQQPADNAQTKRGKAAAGRKAKPR